MSEETAKKWTKPQILEAVLEGRLTKAEAKAELEKIKAAKPNKPRELYCGDKGTVCVRGIRKFPVLNLYPEEIDKLAEVWPQVLEFTALVREIPAEKRKDVEAVNVEPVETGKETGEETGEETEQAAA